MNNIFEFVGKGKILVDGELVEAEFKFKGIYKESDTESRTITFDIVENKVGEDVILYEIGLQP